MSGILQIALFSGALIGLGAAILLSRLIPTQPHLADALTRLDPDPDSRHGYRPQEVLSKGTSADGIQMRLGRLLWSQGPEYLRRTTALQDLAILRKSPAQHMGEKGLMAILGLMFPLGFLLILTSAGITLPFTVTTLFGLALAVVFFFLPDGVLKRNAKAERENFSRSLVTYIDLVAVERRNGSGTNQALQAAANAADNWAFRRIREELRRADWAGQPPWAGLDALGSELGLPELTDLAEIMRLSRDEGTSIYTQLRARSAAARDAALTADLAAANTTTERMTVPVTMLAMVFVAMLGAPALMLLFGGGTTPQ